MERNVRYEKFTKKLVASMLSTAMLMGMSLTHLQRIRKHRELVLMDILALESRLPRPGQLQKMDYSMIQKHLILH